MVSEKRRKKYSNNTKQITAPVNSSRNLAYFREHLSLGSQTYLRPFIYNSTPPGNGIHLEWHTVLALDRAKRRHYHAKDCRKKRRRVKFYRYVPPLVKTVLFEGCFKSLVLQK